MNIYKFQDAVDGKYSFVIAKDEDTAIKFLMSKTSFDFNLVGTGKPEDLKKPFSCIMAICRFKDVDNGHKQTHKQNH